jgi:LytS/YehU family sensor histidine kinase
VDGPVDSVYIAPLILITFLENAFKHGVVNNDPNSWVKISLQVIGKECVYEVENSKLNKVNGEQHEKSGIGLLNVRRRLELSYPNKYQLQIEDLPDRYKITLKLDLT